MTNRYLIGSLVILATVVALTPCLAQADGKGFPRVAVEAAPDIPQQQALIVYRDGRETMIVESTFETRSPEIGWILPLPAEPTDIAPADGQLISSLETALRPRVHTAESPAVAWAAPAWVGLGLLVMIVLTLVVRDRALAERKREDGRHRYSNVYALLIGGWFALLILASTLLPSLGGSLQTAGLEAGVDVLSRQDVGSYEISVLQAETAEALNDWLAANDLTSLSEADRAVVDSYIADGWVFSAARLRVENGKTLTPHPLAVTFPVDAPVYPMRLTALAGGTETLLQLYVVADGTAEVDGMECVVSDAFTNMPEDYAAPGENTNLTITHPDARELIWPGAIVTRLRSRIGRDDMSQDIRPTITDFRPHRQVIYTAAAARSLGGGIVAVGLIAAVLSAAVLFAAKPKPAKPWLALPLSLALAGAATGVAVAATRTVRPVEYENIGRRYVAENHIESVATAVDLYAFKHGMPESVADVEGAEALLRQTLVAAGYLREFPKSLSQGYGPGQYHLEDHGEAVHMVYVDADGRPQRMVVLRPGSPGDARSTDPADAQPASP